MDKRTLIFLVCAAVATSLSIPHYPVRSPVGRLTSPSVHAPFRIAVPEIGDTAWQRAKRDHRDDDYDHPHHRDDHDSYHRDHHDQRGNPGGVTGPVHTFVKTDKNANYKWGVRHHVGPKYV